MAQWTSDLITGDREVGTTTVLTLAGELDLSSSGALREDLLALAEKKPNRIVLNMARISYMDSSGVAALIELLRRAQRGGTTLVLADISARVRSILEIAKLSRIFTIAASEEEAIV